VFDEAEEVHATTPATPAVAVVVEEAAESGGSGGGRGAQSGRPLYRPVAEAAEVAEAAVEAAADPAVLGGDPGSGGAGPHVAGEVGDNEGAGGGPEGEAAKWERYQRDKDDGLFEPPASTGTGTGALHEFAGDAIVQRLQQSRASLYKFVQSIDGGGGGADHGGGGLGAAAAADFGGSDDSDECETCHDKRLDDVDMARENEVRTE